MQYFVADIHFFHKNIIPNCSRPFKSIEDMNNTIIENWNKTIQSHDEVYILGDMLYQANIDQVNDTLKKLNGKKYLIIGNHDDYIFHKNFINQFEWIKDYHVFKYHKREIILFHYPILEWCGKHRNSIHLFGHVHNDSNFNTQLLGKNALNVGVDVIGYTPISIEQVIDKIPSK